MYSMSKKTINIVFAVCLLCLCSCNPCPPGDYDPRLSARSIAVRPSNELGAWLQGDTLYIKGDTAFFRLELKAERFVQVNRWSLFPELLACSPAEPYLTIPADTLELIATSSWDAAHDSGTSLADISTARMYLVGSGVFSDTSFQVFASKCKNSNFLLFEASVCLLKTVCRDKDKENTFVLRLKLRNGAILQSRQIRILRI